MKQMDRCIPIYYVNWKKKKHNLKVEKYVYSADLLRT